MNIPVSLFRDDTLGFAVETKEPSVKTIAKLVINTNI